MNNKSFCLEQVIKALGGVTMVTSPTSAILGAGTWDTVTVITVSKLSVNAPLHIAKPVTVAIFTMTALRSFVK